MASLNHLIACKTSPAHRRKAMIESLFAISQLLSCHTNCTLNAGNADVTWNFGSSFVVNRSGVPVKRFGKESYDEVEKFLVEELKKPKEDLEKPSAK